MSIPQRLLKRLAALEGRQLVSNEWPGGWHQYAAESRERGEILKQIQTLSGLERWERHRALFIVAAEAFKQSDRGAEALDALDAGRVAANKELLYGLSRDDGLQVIRLLVREREILRRQVSPPPPVSA